jgi:hypothetical protein
LRRRLIKLLSAGWIPPSVFRLGASPVSRERASDGKSGHITTPGVPLRGSIPRAVQNSAADFIVLVALASARDAQMRVAEYLL